MTKPFLADFHVHTDQSDGGMALCDVIDLYGSHGFGAIAITDHIAEEKTLFGKAAIHLEKVLTRADFTNYLQETREEAERAWARYRMVVIAGFELSKNSLNDWRSAHVLGLGIREYIPADADPVELIREIHAQGGLAVAAHPVHTRKREKQSYELWDRRRELGELFDAWEVASGPLLFDEVAATKLPKLANGDVHVARQLRSWKTMLHCERHPDAILNAIRRQELSFSFYSPH